MNKKHIRETSSGEFLELFHARQGHFQFESGHHGNLWLDLDLFFLHPKDIQPWVIELARKISSFSIDAICGPMVGGALIAQNIAVELGVDFLYTERIALPSTDTLYPVTYRLPSHLRTLANGRKIAIVDDVINAGSAIRGTLSELESIGARPVVVGALLVLGETGWKFFRGRDLPVEHVAHLPNEIWTPENCPLCAAQIPLHSPD